MASNLRQIKKAVAMAKGASVVREVAINDLKNDPSTTTRAAYRERYRDQLMLAIRDELDVDSRGLPVAFFDGKNYWLADGNYRRDARQRLGQKTMTVKVYRGSLRDASLYSAGANADHGLRRSNGDKRLMVSRLLADDEWRLWSDREIARRCGCGKSLVCKLRHMRQRKSRKVRVEDVRRTYTTKHGTTATISVVANKARASARGEQRPLLLAARRFGKLLDGLGKRLPKEVGMAWVDLLAVITEQA